MLTDSARNGIFQYRDTGRTLHSVNLQTLRSFQFDPTIKAMIAQLPEPNTSDRGDGLNTAGYRFNARSNEFRDQFVYKGDYYLYVQAQLHRNLRLHQQSDRSSGPGNLLLHGSAGHQHDQGPPDEPGAGAGLPLPQLTNELRGGFLRADTGFLDSNQYPKFQVSATNLLFTNPVNTFHEPGPEGEYL